ncbi:MAG: dihydrofolate reductase family protein [Chloroflexi bacterium]|nr:dihydrofolate reductase family protein [Chloroflexota bacterium]
MTELTPLETLLGVEQGDDLPLPDRLAGFYGRLRFPTTGGQYVISNFVTTLDGVVALMAPGHESGGAVSGYNNHDRMVMGILRAVSDAVVVGAGTLRSVPEHLWTAEFIFPSLADEYAQLRTSLGKPEPPLNVIVTSSGNLVADLRVFQSRDVPVLIVTTPRGAKRIDALSMPPSVKVIAVEEDGPVGAGAILNATNEARQSDMVLVEGGPLLMGDFFAERRLHEQFITLAPQVAGRDGSVERPGLVSGKRFAPDDPRWGALVSVKRAGDHLFLRYSFMQPDS